MNNTDMVAQAILDVLFQDDGEGLTKYEIATILDLPAARVKSAMNAARELALEVGRFIPTPLAEDEFRYRLTDNGDVIWASQLFHERQRDGLERVTKSHAEAVRTRQGDLAPEDRILAEKMFELEQTMERQRSELHTQMVDLAVSLRRQRVKDGVA